MQSRQPVEDAARSFFLAIEAAVLANVLPQAPNAREQTPLQWLARLGTTVAGMPATVQRELDPMVGLLLSVPGRLILSGLRTPWQVATQAVHDTLQGLRLSTGSVRAQIFHALRDFSNAVYFALPLLWSVLGYPGRLKP